MKNTSVSIRRQLFRGLLPASVALLAAAVARGQTPNSPYFTAVQSLNPAAYWPLQETNPPPAAFIENNIGSLGAVANMYYSTPDVAYIFGGQTGAIQSDSDTSTYFKGGAGFGLVPTTDNRVSLPPGGAFTVELWTQPANNNQYASLIDQRGPLGSGGNNGSNTMAGWALSQNYVPLMDDGSGTQSGALQGWSFVVYDGGYNGGTYYSGAQALAPYQFQDPLPQPNGWYYVVGVFDGTNASIYVNGVLTSSKSTSVPMPPKASFVPDTWDPLQMAASRGVDANLLPVYLDEVAIYTNVLTLSQITNHYFQATNVLVATPNTNYESTVLHDGAYMYWRMDAEQNGLFQEPSYGSGNPVATNYGTQVSGMDNLTTGATGVNAAIYQPATVPGVQGPAYAGFGSPSYACAFNGLNGAVDAGYNPALNPTGSSGTNSLTVVGWFRGNPCDNNGRLNSLFVHGNASWRATIDNGAVHFNYGPGSDLVESSVNINDGNWHMFAGVYNQTNATQTIYIDAAVSASAAASATIAGDPTYEILLGGSPDYAISNAPIYWNSAERYLAGRLAHVAYFTSALSLAQIQSLYTAAGAPPLIEAQPASGIVTNNGGTTNIFTVTASGASTLVYQWYLTNASGVTKLADTGTNIVGSAAATLTLTNLTDGESGSYYVVVTNNYGAVTSTMSGLQVYAQPFIASQTPSGGPFQMYVNQKTTLSVTAFGAAPLTYQWYTNGTPDTTAGTNSSYALTSVQLTNSGTTYYCVVGNPVSTASSIPVTLTVIPIPASLATNAYSSNILALNPTGYWPLHEVEPPVQADVETNIGTLGVLGAAYYGDWDINFNYPSNVIEMERQVPGALAGDSDPAVSFFKCNGAYLLVPHVSPQTTIKPPFTVEAWCYPTSGGGNGGYGIIVGQGGGSALNSGPNYAGFDLIWSGTTNSFSLAVYNGNGTANNEYKTTSIYPEGQWYHVVGTYDGTNQALYINGQPPAGYQSGTNIYTNMAPDNFSPLCIGAGRWAGNGGADLFGGALDEVAIYTNVLTPAQVASHYAAATTPSGNYKALVLSENPLLYYRMDAPVFVTQPPESTWPVATNYGADALNGHYTPNSIPGSYAVPIAGLSAQTGSPGNGMGAFVDAGMVPDWNPQSYTSFSYTAIFKGYPADNRSFQSIMCGNDATWRANINNGKVDAHGTVDVESPYVYNDGNWHQMFLTYQGNSTALTGTNLLYVDGLLVVSNETSTTNNPTTKIGPEFYIGNEIGFQITNGVPTTNYGPERCISGCVCEAAFFTGTAVPTSQIETLYNAAELPPYFVVQPVSASVNQGVAFTNSSLALGSGGGLTYQWYTNGVPLPGQTGSNLVINPVNVSSASSDYYNVVTGAYGTATSAVVSLTVNAKAIIVSRAPVNTNLTLLTGATITFSVTGGGAAPLTYYWSSNSAVVASGVNLTNFTLSNAPLSASGTYSCLVSNSFSTTNTSWNVTMTTATGGFYQAVLALKPMGYWRLNEADDGLGDGNDGQICHDYIAGNNGIYTNTTLGNPGYDSGDPTTSLDYDPETSAGFDTYATVNSLVYGISNIDFSTPSGANATYTVQAWAQSTGSSGNTPTVMAKGNYYGEELTLDAGSSLHWRFEVVSAAGSDLNANSGVLANDSKWHFLVGVCDEVHSNATLYIDGTNAAVVVIPGGSGITNNPTLPMTIGSRSSTAGAGGAYNEELTGFVNDVAVFNYAMTPSQVMAEYLAAGVGPQFTESPFASTNIGAGLTLVVPAIVSGTAPLSYQWFDQNSNPVLGQTNATLIVSNITANNNYSLVVSNPYGTNTSSSVAVNVVQGVTLEQDIAPPSAVVVAGSSVTFSTGFAGAIPVTNGWQFNGAAVTNSSRISGANTSALTINNVQVGDTGTYQAFATNAYGNAQSSQATLTVAPVLPFNNGLGWSSQGSYTASMSTLWVNSNVLQLTYDLGNESNSAFCTSPLYVGGFEASFTYQCLTGPSSSADGTTFCIQNDPRGTAAIGYGGGALGVSGASDAPGPGGFAISPSFEFEFNIYSGNGVGGVGVSFDTAGAVGPVVAPGSVVINSGDLINTVLTYQNGVAPVTLTDPTANVAYIGFTGADGGSKSSQQISNFSFVSLLPLSAEASGGNLVLTWPDAAGAYTLEESPVLGTGANWTPVTTVPALVNGQLQVTVPISGKTSFYQLVVTNVPSF
jgi:hypothetical protein